MDLCGENRKIKKNSQKKQKNPIYTVFRKLFTEYELQSKSGYFDTGFFLAHCIFCRQVSVKIVLFVIQLENNRIYLSSGFFVLSGFLSHFFFVVKSV